MTTNDMRNLKFEAMIKDINEGLRINYGEDEGNNLPLRLIFDYDKLNEYGKIIMKNTSYNLEYKKDYITPWELRYSEINEGNCVAAAREYISLVKEPQNMDERLKFIFWSLMILTVHKGEDKDEKLTLICDFSRMLNVSDMAVSDLLNIIRCIYGKKRIVYVKSQWIKMVFHDVLRIFEIECKCV